MDVLVDGPFELDKRNLKLKLRGSENQRVINMKKTIQADKIVLQLH
ncbi:4Fe-4S cluster-binding domain-containing protein [Sporolactobacillus sp. Y61]|uniref:4Fe-4S cluster-binding domain-containing protein n=1 Tax=Sporolactobacillus sp. Y61 TaxID=3160863 RepID=A0AAU8IK64_9BACL